MLESSSYVVVMISLTIHGESSLLPVRHGQSERLAQSNEKLVTLVDFEIVHPSMISSEPMAIAQRIARLSLNLSTDKTLIREGRIRMTFRLRSIQRLPHLTSCYHLPLIFQASHQIGSYYYSNKTLQTFLLPPIDPSISLLLLLLAYYMIFSGFWEPLQQQTLCWRRQQETGNGHKTPLSLMVFLGLRHKVQHFMQNMCIHMILINDLAPIKKY